MNLLTARQMHKLFAERGLVASSFHPGAVRTPIWGKGGLLAHLLGLVMWPFMINIQKGADTMIWLSSSNEEEAKNADGHYYFKRQRPSIADFATDEANAHRKCGTEIRYQIGRPPTGTSFSV